VAAITIERRHADERRDLLVIDLSQFWQKAAEGACEHGTNPFFALKEIRFLEQDRMLFEMIIRLLFDLSDLLFEEADNPSNLLG
jgi:hypothetical protein